MIVSDIAGTTRDAVDTVIENEFGKYVFIDTAGIRRKSKILEKIEHYSVLRAYMAVDRADVCVIMIDALEGFTEQDSKIAGYAHESGKACVIAVNKWDAVEKDDKTMQEMRTKLEKDFSFMSYAPIIFISALTGQRLPKLFETDQHGEAKQRNAHYDRQAERSSFLLHGARTAAIRQGKALEDLLYDAGLKQAAGFRLFCKPGGSVSFFISALSGKPDS